jgi:4-carboxymuconolactone decarboxylase
MTEPRLQARIAPLEAPFAPEIDASLRAMMPRNSAFPPLALFRVLVRDPRLAEAMTALGRFLLGRDCALDLHDRELVIDRVCARCGCEYEWGVHVTAYGDRAGLSPAQLEATRSGGAGSPAWSEREALLVRLVDELHDTARVSDDLWAALARHWTEPQLLELLLLAGWYHAISFVGNGARVELEDWAARFPPAAPEPAAVR